jgi:polyribonucleotide nucleotidyltransferase
MFTEFKKEIELGGRKLTFETGKIARQADGAVMVTYGETKVLCTAVGAKKPRTDLDFFPLTVNYQEKTFAAGKIPGGFFKREARPSEKETLTSRLIDRPVRPLFHPNYKCETQLICTVLAHDLENDPDITAMIGTSAALTISGIPFMGPIGASRVGYIDGNYVLNPPVDDMPRSQLNLVVAGTSEGVLMVESEASELSEDVMLGAVMFGHKANQEVIQAIIELAQACAKKPRDVPETPAKVGEVQVKVRELAEAGLRTAYAISEKSSRQSAIAEVRSTVSDAFSNDDDATDMIVSGAFKILLNPANVLMAVIQKQYVQLYLKLASCRVLMVVPYLPAVKPRQWLWRRWVLAKMSRSLMVLTVITGNTFCCIIIFHLIQSVRLAV